MRNPETCRGQGVGYMLAARAYVATCSCGHESAHATRRAAWRAIADHFATA